VTPEKKNLIGLVKACRFAGLCGTVLQNDMDVFTQRDNEARQACAVVIRLLLFWILEFKKVAGIPEFRLVRYTSDFLLSLRLRLLTS